MPAGKGIVYFPQRIFEQHRQQERSGQKRQNPLQYAPKRLPERNLLGRLMNQRKPKRHHQCHHKAGQQHIRSIRRPVSAQLHCHHRRSRRRRAQETQHAAFCHITPSQSGKRVIHRHSPANLNQQEQRMHFPELQLGRIYPTESEQQHDKNQVNRLVGILHKKLVAHAAYQQGDNQGPVLDEIDNPVHPLPFLHHFLPVQVNGRYLVVSVRIRHIFVSRNRLGDKEIGHLALGDAA